MKKTYVVHIEERLCKGYACSLCQQTCPTDVFALSEHPTSGGILPMQVVNGDHCVGCQRCAHICPELAIDVLPEGATPPAPPARPAATPPSTAPAGWQTVDSLLPAGSHYMSGNEACAEGALAAGCRFYAGYPITPSSEAMVHLARRLPELQGTFIQMEDEIGSMAAIIGASWAGVKSMTATSGPGLSLMQENIGYAAMTETPCVIMDAQRAGPSTGQASRPAQGDVMSARWGAHGGPDLIALAPWSVQEMYDLTMRAFNLAERFRTPVILLADEVVAHLQETVTILPHVPRYQRARWPVDSPFGVDDTGGIPPMPAFGEGAHLLVTGSTHDGRGFRRTTDGAAHEKLVRRLSAKILDHRDEIDDWEEYYLEDADRLIVAYGSVARSALWAVQAARQAGQQVGMLRLKTLWPFPDEVIERLAAGRQEIIAPEMNLGQVAREVQRSACQAVTPLNQADGELIDPRRILRYIMEWSWER
jgi:2-oxoglutarate/2-oxoacid ferredoxin oxidoreductase subunit alpha